MRDKYNMNTLYPAVEEDNANLCEIARGVDQQSNFLVGGNPVQQSTTRSDSKMFIPGLDVQVIDFIYLIHVIFPSLFTYLPKLP